MLQIFPLQTGTTKVPYGQFYLGREGWTGAGAFWRMLTDTGRMIRVPIHAYLLVHPQAGPILLDAGISAAQARGHRGYYRGLTGLTTDADEYDLPPGQELEAQLARLGYGCGDIARVVLTHLHEDHVGCLGLFPHAEVTVPAAEWAARGERALGVRPIYYAPSLAPVRRWRQAELTSGPFPGFDASLDLLGDGTLRLLPTPGHSAGHASLLVDQGDHQVLLAGDALYTLRHLAVDQLWAFVPGDGRRVAQYVDSVRRILRLRAALPELVVVPTHDHTEYQRDLLLPALADGLLDPAERAALRAHEAALFDAPGHLRPGREPRFLAPAEGAVGDVA